MTECHFKAALAGLRADCKVVGASAVTQDRKWLRVTEFPKPHSVLASASPKLASFPLSAG